MNIPKELTIITPVSKFLTMFLLLSLPFVGFFLGLRYEQQFTEYLESRANVDQYLLKTQPTTTQSASTANPDSIGANWKTYTNEKYGYSFKHPSFLIVEDTFNPIFIKNNDLVFMEILSERAEVGSASFNEIYNSPNGQIKPYPSYYDVEYFSTVKTYTQTKISNVKVDGKIAVRWESERIIEEPPRTILTTGVSILTEKYHFSVWTDNENQENPKSIELFDQILSTFKFTN